MYLRTETGRPVGCIAINYKKGDKQLTYQVSVLNPSDKFDRSVARQLATGRLLEKPIVISVDPDFNIHDISLAVMDHIAYTTDRSLPSRAVKCAKLWVNKNLPF
jgi:hypothetical protein